MPRAGSSLLHSATPTVSEINLPMPGYSLLPSFPLSVVNCKDRWAMEFSSWVPKRPQLNFFTHSRNASRSSGNTQSLSQSRPSHILPPAVDCVHTLVHLWTSCSYRGSSTTNKQWEEGMTGFFFFLWIRASTVSHRHTSLCQNLYREGRKPRLWSKIPQLQPTLEKEGWEWRAPPSVHTF